MDNPKLLTALTILLWSFGPTLGRLISLQSQFLLLALSFTFTFITQLIYTYQQNKVSFFATIKKVDFKFLLIGLFGYGIYWLGFIKSFQAYNSGSEATILNYTWPVFTVLFTELLFRSKKEKSRIIYVVETNGIVLGFIAILIFATRGNITSFLIANVQGLLWGLLAGSSYGFFSSYSSTVPKEKQSIFLLSSIFSSLLLMLLLSFSEIKLVTTLTLKDILVVALLGSVVDGLGYIVWTRANRLAKEKQISISSIASLTFLLPVLSLIIITIVFKENSLLQPYFLITLILLLISSILCQKSKTIANYFLHI